MTDHIEHGACLHLDFLRGNFPFNHSSFAETEQFSYLDFTLVTTFNNRALARYISFDNTGRADDQFRGANEIAFYDAINTNIAVAFDFSADSGAFTSELTTPDEGMAERLTSSSLELPNITTKAV